jgi:hypothetical protein
MKPFPGRLLKVQESLGNVHPPEHGFAFGQGYLIGLGVPITPHEGAQLVAIEPPLASDLGTGNLALFQHSLESPFADLEHFGRLLEGQNFGIFAGHGRLLTLGSLLNISKFLAECFVFFLFLSFFVIFFTKWPKGHGLEYLHPRVSYSIMEAFGPRFPSHEVFNVHRNSIPLFRNHTASD